jgi:hypothetical protein
MHPAVEHGVHVEQALAHQLHRAAVELRVGMQTHHPKPHGLHFHHKTQLLSSLQLLHEEPVHGSRKPLYGKSHGLATLLGRSVRQNVAQEENVVVLLLQNEPTHAPQLGDLLGAAKGHFSTINGAMRERGLAHPSHASSAARQCRDPRRTAPPASRIRFSGSRKSTKHVYWSDHDRERNASDKARHAAIRNPSAASDIVAPEKMDTVFESGATQQRLGGA